MKKTSTLTLRLAAATLMAAAFTATQAQQTDRGFIHPGALHTQADFDRIKAQLETKDPTTVAAFQKLAANEYSQATVKTYPTETVKRGGGSGENYMNAARGAAMAYQNALRWKIKGTRDNADNAVKILNSWARTCKSVTGDTNQSLAAGLYGYAFANAAELMRDYDGWKKEDFEAFKRWILDIWYPRSIDFLRRRHGTWEQGTPGHYWSNWGLCNALALMSYGVLLDDVFIYNQGVSFYELDQVGSYKDKRTAPIDNNGLTEFIGNLVPTTAQDARGPYGRLGQMQESGRDQGHALMAAGLATDICQIGWNQGDDLFSLKDNRLAAGLEFVAAYNAGEEDLPWTDYWYHDVRTAYNNSWKQTAPNEGGRGNFRPYWDRIIGHYEGVKGVKMTYARQMRDKEPIDNGGGAYGQTSGGFDHLGFTTLTCRRPDRVPADQVPTRIIPNIIRNNVTYREQSIMGGTVNKYAYNTATTLPKGTKLTLSPALPDSVSDTGKWLWDNGATTKELEITADSSHIYRVTYTNGKGVKSTQMFSIAVQGDCSEETLTPYSSVNGTVTYDTLVSVQARKAFTLGVNNKAGWGKYKWSTGATTESVNLQYVSADRTYSVTYTNQGGREQKVNFHVHIRNISPSLTVNGGSVIYTDTYIAKKGQNIVLKPIVSKAGGTWLWSNGATTKEVSLENIQHTAKLSVVYSIDGKEERLDYSIYIPQQGTVKLADGDYFIQDAATGKLLTNNGTSPLFDTRKEDDDQSQRWTISRDGSRYKIVSADDGKYINENGAFSANPYYTEWNSYNFFGVEDGDIYAIQNGGKAGSDYWTINADGSINGKGASTLSAYPFIIKPATTTGIQAVSTTDKDILFTRQGQRLTVTATSPVKACLYDAKGSLLKQTRSQSTVTLPFDDLPTGLYIIKAQTNKGEKSGKIVI